MSSELYDRIGRGYDATRRADPEILATLLAGLDPQPAEKYIDIGCGTGNYTARLAQAGGQWWALDPSAAMIAQARGKSSRVHWLQGRAEDTGFAARDFGGGVCVLALHHFTNPRAALAEMGRILKPGARFLIFGTTPDRIHNYWLCHYFPAMMARSARQMPSLEKLAGWLRGTGLAIAGVKPFFITDSLEDLFLYSGKHRPEMYLSARLRKGISSFADLCPPDELKRGLAGLARDIKSGDIQSVMDNYQNPGGDYCWVSLDRV